jgi:hypothetical protein
VAERISITSGIGYIFRSNGGGSVLALTSPTTVLVGVNTTTATVESEEATGGVGPYTYSAEIVYDSTGLGVAYIASMVGRDALTELLSNGQILTITFTVTDAVGATASANATVVVAAEAASSMLPGANPESQTIASDQTTASISFSPVTGSYTEPVSYNASLATGSALLNLTGTDVDLASLAPGTAQLVLLRATDSSAIPKVADAYGLVTVLPSEVSPLAWQPIRSILFTDAINAQGPFVNGSQTVPLVDAITGITVNCTLVHSMLSGSFSSITSQITEGDGWRIAWAATGSSTNCRGPIRIPLPVTFGYDDDIRVIIKGVTSQPVSSNSSYWQICRDGPTPAADSSACWGGNRQLKNGAATSLRLNAQSGVSGSLISNSSTPPCPLSWLDGSTETTTVLYLPRYTNRARVNMSGTGSTIVCDLGLTGVAASSSASRGGWCAGNSAVWFFHGGSNGGANGGGNQWTRITQLTIERRTLP